MLRRMKMMIPKMKASAAMPPITEPTMIPVRFGGLCAAGKGRGMMGAPVGFGNGLYDKASPIRLPPGDAAGGGENHPTAG